MKNRKKIKKLGIILVSLLAIGLGGIYIQKSLAVKTLGLIIDGEDITEMASPLIRDDRSLVPIRAITEKLGGEVSWDGVNRRVAIERNGKFVSLSIDSRLVAYGDENKTYALTDSPPVIIDDLTYVPLRLVSNALDIGITWNEEDRNIYVDSKASSQIENLFDMEIVTPVSRQVVEGEIPLQVVIGDIKKDVKEIKYLLLDPITAKGYIIARGELLTGEYIYTPKIEDKGEKVIVAALYDTKGKFLAGDAMGVNIKLKPEISLEGVVEDEIIEETIKLEASMNFAPRYVNYEIKRLCKDCQDSVTLIEKQDPYGSYSFYPQVNKSGDYEFRVIAYDENNKAYESKKIKAMVYPEHKLTLTGVKEGMVVNKSVSLGSIRNFDVSETQFILVDPKTKKEEVLSTQGYGNYTWFPGLDYKGDKEVLVRVKDTRGKTHESQPVKIYLDGKAQLLIRGIGPKQIVTSEIDISSVSNVKLDKVDYILENPKTGEKEILNTMEDYNSSYKFIPREKDSGERIFRAVSSYGGELIKSEDIPIKIYLGQLYGPKPIVEKDKFLDFASKLARESYLDTNMSAAIQTAQAILETGWGQSVPADKYTGEFSNNLFGIKGKADAGAVISNTWEEYNGSTYRIDAEFRAYKDPKDSWNDHKSLLLGAERYSIFRDVMYDSTRGAWAIRRAGYATDSSYSMKLMEIIDNNNLRELDKLGI